MIRFNRMTLKNRLAAGLLLGAVLAAAAGSTGIVALRRIESRMQSTSQSVSTLIDRQRLQSQQTATLRGLEESILNASDDKELTAAATHLEQAKHGAITADVDFMENIAALLGKKKSLLHATEQLTRLQTRGDSLPHLITTAAETITQTVRADVKRNVNATLDEATGTAEQTEREFEDELDTLSSQTNAVIAQVKAAFKVRSCCQELNVLVKNVLLAEDTAVVEYSRHCVSTLLQNANGELAILPKTELATRVAAMLDELATQIDDLLKQKNNRLRGAHGNDVAEESRLLAKRIEAISDTLSQIQRSTLEMADSAEFDAATTIDDAMSRIRQHATDSQKRYRDDLQRIANLVDGGFDSATAAWDMRSECWKLCALVKDAFLATALSDINCAQTNMSRLIQDAKNRLAQLPADDVSQKLRDKIDMLPPLVQSMLNGKKEQIAATTALLAASRHTADHLARRDRDMLTAAETTKQNVAQTLRQTASLVGWWQAALLSLGIAALVLALVVSHLVLHSITRPIQRTIHLLREIAEGEGDLTRRLEVSSDDELGELARWFNTFVDNLKGMVYSVRSAAMVVESSSKQQSLGAAKQSTATTQVTQSANELLAASEQMRANADTTCEQAQLATEECATGARRVNDAVRGIAGVRDDVERIAAHILDLGTRSRQITGILDLINDLAKQTNLLSLNASIEAAGAGDSGKRFAIVAAEIRKLAERATESTDEIRCLIDGIQDTVNGTIMATEEGAKSVERGVQLTADVHEIFDRIAQCVATSAQNAAMIQQSSTEQAIAIEQMTSALRSVDVTVKEAAETSRQLEKESRTLVGAAGRFRVDTTADSPRSPRPPARSTDATELLVSSSPA